MFLSGFKDKVAAFWFGRDWMVDAKRWTLSVLLVPRHDLTEEGEMTLAGLRVDVVFMVPLARGCGSRQSEVNRDDYHWRSPVRISIRSDAGKIASLNAARAQCPS